MTDAKRNRALEKPKIAKIFDIIAQNLSDADMPFAAIGALALGVYGLPRHTSDIDLLTDGIHRDAIKEMMTRLGYTCYQDTDSFAQYDSDMGILGNIDFMFVSTADGKDILNRRIMVQDDLWGHISVVQPTDYIILKLMAISNNPERSLRDEADIIALINGFSENMLPDIFEELREDRLSYFAGLFGQKERVQKLLEHLHREKSSEGNNHL